MLRWHWSIYGWGWSLALEMMIPYGVYIDSFRMAGGVLVCIWIIFACRSAIVSENDTGSIS